MKLKSFATTLEAVTSNKSKTTIKLSMSNKDAAVFAQKYLQSIDKELTVSFEDPQLEMELTYPDKPYTGIHAKIDSSGVVETVQAEADPEEDDADLFQQEPAEEGEEPIHYEDLEDSGDIGRAEHEDDGSNDEALIDAIERGDFRESTDTLDADPVLEPDKEEIEAFIIERTPRFDDIEFNFPELVKRKRDGAKWMEIAKDLKISSTVLSKAYSEYKKRVAKLMVGAA